MTIDDEPRASGHQSPDLSHEIREENGISFLDLAIVLAKRKKWVLVTPVVAGIIGAITSMLLPSTYTAVTKILPPQQTQSNAVAVLGQLGVAGVTGGGGLAAALRNPSDIFVALLKGNTISDAVIERFQLKQIWGLRYQEDARRALARATKISATKEGIIYVDFGDSEPARAAAVANSFVDELQNLTLSLAVTEASQRRLYFERELKKANEKLTEALDAIRQFQESTGVISDTLLGLSAQTSATLRAQITAKEVQISSMRAFATSSNPELIRAEQELAGLRRQVARIDDEDGRRTGSVVVGAAKVPAMGQEYLKKMREARYHETLFELLARQYESAKLDESKNATLIQVFDKADVPERRSSPKRRLIVMVFSLAGLVLGIIVAFVLATLERLAADHSWRSRLEVLKHYLAWRSH